MSHQIGYSVMMLFISIHSTYITNEWLVSKAGNKNELFDHFRSRPKFYKKRRKGKTLKERFRYQARYRSSAGKVVK